MKEIKLDPIKPQTPKANAIKCATCKYRDKTVITINGIKRPVGVTRGYCDAYPEAQNGKPREVLFDNADCIYYKSDNK